MLVKRIAAYASIFNRFPVVQPESSKVRHVSAFFLHILASPGYAPRTIAVNFTWIEREFNACQKPRSQHVPIYLQPFPSNSSRKFKSSPFSTLFAHFGLPWVCPESIAINVTRL